MLIHFYVCNLVGSINILGPNVHWILGHALCFRLRLVDVFERERKKNHSCVFIEVAGRLFNFVSSFKDPNMSHFPFPCIPTPVCLALPCIIWQFVFRFFIFLLNFFHILLDPSFKQVRARPRAAKSCSTTLRNCQLCRVAFLNASVSQSILVDTHTKSTFNPGKSISVRMHFNAHFTPWKWAIRCHWLKFFLTRHFLQYIRLGYFRPKAVVKKKC